MATSIKTINLKWPQMLIHHGHFYMRKQFSREQLDDPSPRLRGKGEWIEVKPVFYGAGSFDLMAPRLDLWIRVVENGESGYIQNGFTFLSKAGIRYNPAMISVPSTENLVPASHGGIHGPNLADYLNRQLVHANAYISQIGYAKTQNTMLPAFWNRKTSLKKTIQCWDLPSPRDFTEKLVDHELG